MNNQLNALEEGMYQYNQPHQSALLLKLPKRVITRLLGMVAASCWMVMEGRGVRKHLMVTEKMRSN